MRRVKLIAGSTHFLAKFAKNRFALTGLYVLCFFVIAALMANVIAPGSPLSGGRPPLTPPSFKYLMGTDDLGRDTFSGVIHGVRISLGVGLFGAVSSAFLGTIIGGASASLGGKVDEVVMRATEVFQVLPAFFVALVVTAIFGASIWNVFLVISLTYWTSVGRVVRSEVLSLRERDFVIAARAIGARSSSVFFTEILPNAAPVIVVSSSLEMGNAILLEAALSFLGLGDVNLMSWGLMLNNAQSFIHYAWWMAVFPGLAIFLMVLSMNLVGDGLNDALNPKLRER